MSIKFTCTGFAHWVLLTIQEPEGTNDSGITAKHRAIELMQAAGLTTTQAQQMLQEWLDAPLPTSGRPADDSEIIQAMAAGAHKLFAESA
jgi:hypothetical protein